MRSSRRPEVRSAPKAGAGSSSTDFVLEALHLEARDLRAAHLPATRDAKGFVLDSPLGPTSVHSRVCASRIEKGPTHLVTAETVLPGDLQDFDDLALADLNQLASFAALYRRDDGRIACMSRVSVFPGGEEMFRYADLRLLVSAALLHAEAVRRAVAFAEDDRRFPPLSRGRNESCSRTEFNEIGALFSSNACPVEVKRTAVAAELPWNRGERSLVEIENLKHPMWGHGLGFSLRLPHRVATERVGVVCRDLNRNDALHQPIGAFFGAWCSNFTDDRLRFVGFVPSMMYAEGLALKIASWLGHRSDWAAAVLGRSDA